MTNAQYCIARAFHQRELEGEPGWDATARALFPDAPGVDDSPVNQISTLADSRGTGQEAAPSTSRERGLALREANRRREHNMVLAALGEDFIIDQDVLQRCRENLALRSSE